MTASQSYYSIPAHWYGEPLPDPPGSPDATPLTLAELQTILTGSGHPSRQGTPTSEDNPDAYPYKARGLYPNPGHYERQDRRNPITSAGLTKIEYFVPSLTWEIELEKPTADEERHIDQVCGWLDAMPGGLPRAIRLMATAPQYGFSLQELEWLEEEDGTLGIRSLQWVRPASIESWIVDRAGREVGFRQVTERGSVIVPLGKCLHFAWRYRPREPEGRSALRPLTSYDEYKGDVLRDDRLAWRRFSGMLEWTQPPGGAADGDLSAVELISELWQQGRQAYSVKPQGWESDVKWPAGNKPDPTPMLQYLDHQHARQLDDTLGELGMARYGSHAVGSELRANTQRQLTGVCSEMATAIEQQLLRRVWSANGWPGRVPRVLVTGFEDTARVTSIIQAAQAGLVDPTDPRIREQVARILGLSPGRNSGNVPPAGAAP
jgi:hypothetical protein